MEIGPNLCGRNDQFRRETILAHTIIQTVLDVRRKVRERKLLDIPPDLLQDVSLFVACRNSVCYPTAWLDSTENMVGQVHLKNHPPMLNRGNSLRSKSSPM